MRLLKSNVLLKIFNNYLFDSKLPININYFYNFGSLLGLFLVIQIISGIFLAMYFQPNINNAFNSIEYLMREVPYGWLIRYIHANSASLFFLVVYLHIARGFLYESYFKKSTWFIGIIILLIMIITAFLGYSLVWGQMSLWAATVITNLLSTIPFIGNNIVEFIYGGFVISSPTLNRFYSLHYLLPFLIVGLTITHLIVLHDQGGTNPLGNTINTVNFNSYYTLQDILGIIIFILILNILVFYAPNFMLHPDNYIEANFLITPTHIVPEIYLLPYYAILRAITNKTLGVLALLSSILILFTLPYTNTNLINTNYFKPISYIFVLIFFIVFILLTWIGQSHLIEPYITIGQILTIYYFTYFLLLIPIISIIELLLFIII